MSTAPWPSRPAPASAQGSLALVPEATIVTSEGCHFCEDAVEELERRPDGVAVTLVPADTERGRELLERHRPGMFPLVLLDGVFFSSGRLPRRKLDKALAARRGVSS